jgi:hypothetical protein
LDTDEDIPLPLQRSLDLFGAYAIANYWPWSRLKPPCIPECTRWPEGATLSLDWDGFCTLLDYLYDPLASFIARGRLSELSNLAFGSRDHPIHGNWHKRALTKYRYHEADNLKDPATINPFGLTAERLRQEQLARGADLGGNFDPLDDIDARAAKEMNDLYERNR